MTHVPVVYAALGQPGVGFLTALIVGALAGWVAEKFTRSDHGLLMNMVMGILGAMTANLIAGLLGVGIYGFLPNLISATIGAILIITIYRSLAGRRTTTY